MLTIYLVRHGQTDYNLNGIIQGGGIDSDLNETGRIQALQFYLTHKHLKFDALYCSAQKRTRQTLAPWLESGYSCESFAGLNEFGWGVQEGMKPKEADAQKYRRIISNWSKGIFEEKFEGAETPQEVWNRAEPVFNHLMHRHKTGKILICSHGRTIRIILCMLLGEGLTNMEPYKHGNTGLSILELSVDGNRKIKRLNDLKHLNF